MLILDQGTLQYLDSILVYGQNFYRLHTKVKGIGDNRIIKTKSPLHGETYYGFQLKVKNQVEVFEQIMLKQLPVVLVLVHRYDVFHSVDGYS